MVSGNSSPSAKPHAKGRLTPAIETLTAARPNRLTTDKSVSIPVRSKSIRMPSWETASIMLCCSRLCGKSDCCRSGQNAPRTDGPSRMPAISWPMIAGWPIRCMASPSKRPHTKSTMISERKIASGDAHCGPAAGAAESGLGTSMSSNAATYGPRPAKWAEAITTRRGVLIVNQPSRHSADNATLCSVPKTNGSAKAKVGRAAGPSPIIAPVDHSVRSAPPLLQTNSSPSQGFCRFTAIRSGPARPWQDRDMRQATLKTNQGKKNSAFAGFKIIKKFQEWSKAGLALLSYEQHTYRCNQDIADLGDGFFPSEPTTTSLNATTTGHDGVFIVATAKVA